MLSALSHVKLSLIYVRASERAREREREGRGGAERERGVGGGLVSRVLIVACEAVLFHVYFKNALMGPAARDSCCFFIAINILQNL